MFSRHCTRKTSRKLNVKQSAVARKQKRVLEWEGHFTARPLMDNSSAANTGP